MFVSRITQEEKRGQGGAPELLLVLFVHMAVWKGERILEADLFSCNFSIV